MTPWGNDIWASRSRMSRRKLNEAGNVPAVAIGCVKVQKQLRLWWHWGSPGSHSKGMDLRDVGIGRQWHVSRVWAAAKSQRTAVKNSSSSSNKSNWSHWNGWESLLQLDEMESNLETEWLVERLWWCQCCQKGVDGDREKGAFGRTQTLATECMWRGEDPGVKEKTWVSGPTQQEARGIVSMMSTNLNIAKLLNFGEIIERHLTG